MGVRSKSPGFGGLPVEVRSADAAKSLDGAEGGAQRSPQAQHIRCRFLARAAGGASAGGTATNSPRSGSKCIFRRGGRVVSGKR